MHERGAIEDVTVRRARRWSFWFVIVLQIALVGLGVRTAYLQIVRHDHFVSEQEKYLVRVDNSTSERGRIHCAGGETLVRNRPYWRVILNPLVAGGKPTEDPDKNRLRSSRVRAAVRFVGDYLELDEPSGILEDRALVFLDRKKQYLHLTDTDDAHELERMLRQLEVFCHKRDRDAAYAFPRHSIVIERKFRREYPYGSLALTMLGETRPSGTLDENLEPLPVGVWGIELDYDAALSGDGREPRRHVDGRSRRYRIAHAATEESATTGGRGADLGLTVDLNLQILLEERLNEALVETQCRRAVAAVVDPHTGAVLAAACAPSLQQGDARRLWGTEELTRRLLKLDSFHYEPGSTIKPLILTEAIQRGLDLSETVTGTSLSWSMRDHGIRRVITDSCPPRDHGLTIVESVVHSSNIGMVKLGMQLGESGLREALGRYGFVRVRDKTDPWTLYSTSSLPMGYELYVTPWKLLRAYSAIANGGYAVEPYVVATVDGRPTPTAARDPKREENRLADAETMHEIRAVLRRAALEGTGRTLADKPPGMAAKTGTARIFEGGEWIEDYRSSMMAFAPWDAPEYLVYVRIDRPQGRHFGAQVAGLWPATFWRLCCVYPIIVCRSVWMRPASLVGRTRTVL